MTSDSLTRVTRLAVEYHEAHDGHVWLASAALFIDGEEQLASIGSGKYIGLRPGDLASQHPFVEPTEQPNEVLLYRCDCGEVGCSAVVARCYRIGDEVVWDHFACGNPPPVDLAAPRPADDALVFSVDDYEVFVSRVRELALRHPDGN